MTDVIATIEGMINQIQDAVHDEYKDFEVIEALEKILKLVQADREEQLADNTALQAIIEQTLYSLGYSFEKDPNVFTVIQQSFMQYRDEKCIIKNKEGE